MNLGKGIGALINCVVNEKKLKIHSDYSYSFQHGISGNYMYVVNFT